MLIPVILSGGAGSRLWPVSREAHPKPFMSLPDGDTLLQKTMKRMLSLDGVSNVMTITNRELYFETKDSYEGLNAGDHVSYQYILEPIGRNTAPAIAMAALSLMESDPDAVMLVVAADHLIQKEAAFEGAVRMAANLAEKDFVVTFGIRPTHPEVGFGYIEKGAGVDSGAVDGAGASAWEVARFVEKPDLSTAEDYLASGQFMWNSGMFCVKPGVFLEGLKKHAMDVYDASVAAWDASDTDAKTVELDKATFAEIPSISVDYAVMEQAKNIAMVECDIDWSDIGSWSAFGNLVAADENGNRTLGETLLIDSKGCFVESADRLVSVVGCDDLVIVDTPDALLVSNKSHSQDVKKVVAALKENGHDAYKFHRTVHRPWGTYTVLEEGINFKIKNIMVKPGSELSLQMHHHRSEHWIVVSGTAKVVNGDHEFLVKTNESTYIPAGTHHRLGNPGVLDLVMIEVQSGEYLGEDDIVRFEDIYGRS